MGRFASSVQSRRDGVDGLVLDRKQGGEIFWQLKGEAGDLKDLEVQAAGAEEVIVLPTNKHCKPSSTTPTTYSSFYYFNLRYFLRARRSASSDSYSIEIALQVRKTRG